MKYQKIKEALQALQEGKLVLVMDDKERENEGDLICSAQFATTENVNFMATYAKGLICMPMSESLANSSCFPLWLKIIQITMKLPLQFLLIIRILQQVFLPKKED